LFTKANLAGKDEEKMKIGKKAVEGWDKQTKTLQPFSFSFPLSRPNHLRIIITPINSEPYRARPSPLEKGWDEALLATDLFKA
jgi:hypothetical protein